MPQIQRITNIRQMLSLDAKQLVLAPIRTEAYQRAALDPAAEQNLADLADHPDYSVVHLALEVIEAVRDKQAFLPVLLKHANDHTRPACANAAYKAMQGAKDLGLFYHALEQGVRAAVHPDISCGALSPILVEVTRNSSPGPQLQNILMNAMEHPVDKVVSAALAIVWIVKDKTPFAAALQKCMTQSGNAMTVSSASRLLQSINVLPSSESEAEVVAVAKTAIDEIGNVRLDFNIEANGGGPALHRLDAISALSKQFDQSAQSGAITTKAKIFYSQGGELAEDSVIAVQFPASDKDIILEQSLRGLAPEFDLKTGNGGVYTATLKKGLTF